MLDANLAAIRQFSPRYADALGMATRKQGLEWITSTAGELTARVDGRLLASRRDPFSEARRWAAAVDVEHNGCFVVHGFGLGYHVWALADRLNGSGLIVCFEPDLWLVRSVMERLDHRWIAQTHLLMYFDPEQTPLELHQRYEGFCALGVKFLRHPATSSRRSAIMPSGLVETMTCLRR